VREGRTALAITIFLIATLTVPAVFLGSARSAAQQAQQPSPSGTGPAIQLLNPSDYSTSTREGQPTAMTIQGPQISDKDTSDDDADRPGQDPKEYHFKAVVTNPPANAYVEFFLIQTSGNNTQTFNLGCAAAGQSPGGPCEGMFKNFGAVELIRDIPDTFVEGMLAPNDDPSQTDRGSATVRAVLYANAGQNEVARDDQPVLINQSDRSGSDPLSRGEADPQKTAETVEIVYPEHGGLFGLFKPGGSGAGIGVVDVVWSSGTDAVQVFYSVSPTDVDPDWKSCSTSETTGTSTTAASAQDGVRCTLTGSDQPENVTAIAAVARDNESDQASAVPTARNNSGDAHRVVGYSQVPGIVRVDDANVAGPLPGCSGLLTAQVLDDTTAARPIAGVDVDVHAQGPTDNLAFHTHAANDEQSQFDQTKPDRTQAPQGHATESGRRCSNNNQSGTQGNHAIGGGPDRKHVESQDDTDDDGRFVFRLWNDAAGRTRVTAWADTNDDDRFCPDERSGDGTVTWAGSTAPAPPAEGPEPPPCPNPSPSGSGSSGPSQSSTSPTGGTTASTSPSTTSPSGSASTSPSTSPSSTASGSVTPSGTTTSPTNTSTTTGGGGSTTQQAATSVSLEASRQRTTFGRRFTLSGTVDSTSTGCTAFASIRILRDVIGGTDDFELVAQTQTDANGAYSESFDADRSASYVAQVVESAACDDSTSAPETVLVKVKVSLRVSDDLVERGQRVRLTITTAPCPATAGDKVLLFRAIEGQFGKSGKKESNARCSATFKRRIRTSSVFQGRWPKQTPELIAGRSRSKAVRIAK
jgi:hypothetical protein